MGRPPYWGQEKVRKAPGAPGRKCLACRAGESPQSCLRPRTTDKRDVSGSGGDPRQDPRWAVASCESGRRESQSDTGGVK
ncbi:hypothetical protein NDU88_001068 [Pleurodeles waltl]|uniref:Uncharacterized protein n=1 Tax=Pleurodeles waltl TaxID=8319 RepID=A0AAV7U731_PLEWA|nr:hypothetical protein NDU88_001068 [Pleurodeles waltl]